MLSIDHRVRKYSALGDPIRLKILDLLAISDLSPSCLIEILGINSNLLSHHLDVLEEAQLVSRKISNADGRRRYVSIVASEFKNVEIPKLRVEPVLFVCTKNSGRSQLASALWTAITHQHSGSAGIRPANHISPDAELAARNCGLHLIAQTPKSIDDESEWAQVITVCDIAYEEVGERNGWLHWSSNVPEKLKGPRKFERLIEMFRSRIQFSVAGL